MERTFSRGQESLSKYAEHTLAYDDQGRPIMDGKGQQKLTQAGDTLSGFLRQALERSRHTRTLEGFDLSDPEGRVEWAWKQPLAHYRKRPAKNGSRTEPAADTRTGAEVVAAGGGGATGDGSDGFDLSQAPHARPSTRAEASARTAQLAPLCIRTSRTSRSRSFR